MGHVGQRDRKVQPTHCRHCAAKLGERRVTVNEPAGLSGHFCNAECYTNCRANRPTASVQTVHADLDTLMPVEGILGFR